ncbi:SLOG family protein [Bombilactobacillus thymidiniphilus]|uniref:SLOG family protein n=1 Tax=Bombilactobacillus thymidiniphilus TaxID=2923363 RepID=A0ABY4PCS5_9LACO|nr:SLOG family protein [Bombilactobacillus thymidiniphilus]UQS83569.1 SLOG family protein [Bombilactobacillus thymidiniphilus]
METIKNLWVTGYRSYELNIFQKDDLKEKVIADYLEQTLIEYCERGLQWVLTGGQLGIDQWVVQVVKRPTLQVYQLQVAVILPFLNMAQKWNEKNQQVFEKTLQLADFTTNLSTTNYTSPQQFKQWQMFMLTHTAGSLLVYDPEFPGKCQHEYQAMLNYQQNHAYHLQLLTFYDLQDFADNQTKF